MDDNLIETIKLNDEQLNKFNNLIDLRMINVPIQYIIGEWDFRDLTLKVKPPVFIPRPETEELIDLIINDYSFNDGNNNINFIDIGCGCGTISLSLLNELKQAKCLAIDKSQIACDLTKENAKNLNLDKQLTVLNYNIKSFDKNLSNNVITEQYDLIVSNPPYIAYKKLKKLSDDIKLYEDIKAFDGGKDGLDIINIIFDIAVKHLKGNCFLWLEIDSDQTELIKEILLKSTYNKELKFIQSFKDIFNNERFIKIIKL